ncbi:MAG: Fic family protein [Dehalococcoidia bacterium]|nr:Fic family protein [Dehalococcoidia bacterium]
MAIPHVVGRGRPSRRSIYEQLETQIEELWGRLGGLPNRAEASDVWQGIWYEEAHNSTAIEGNTLVLKQVRTLLDEGRAVGGKELREYMEVEGYARAAEWVYGQAIDGDTPSELITLTELRYIHELAMGPVWAVAPHPDAGAGEAPGGFRQHDIHSFPGGMTPPPWTDVPARVSDWVAEANDIDAESALFPERIAVVHAAFERIHPFIDGNGRVGRLVLNLMLVRLGYPPAIIYKSDRARYLRALQRADEGEPGALGELIARAIRENLYRFVIPAVAGPLRLVPLGALARPGLAASALRTAANRNRLQATRGADGQWRSTQKWVDEYIATKHLRAGSSTLP